jgi:Zn-dependent peptidase ImmA (M78 family)/transcriptional regulator with XRE-family HTH domain
MMVPTGPPVNSEMVTLAREARAWTQTELARRASLSQAQLSKIEAGLSEVADDVLARLAAALGRPREFFFQTDQVFGPGLSEFFHRRRQDVAAKALARVHAQINIIRMHVSRLLKAVDLPELRIRPMDVDEYGGRPDEVARIVRASWQLRPGPVLNVVRVIEDAGGVVIRYPFGTPQIDAISRVVPGLPPLFFVNQGLPADRERLTLAHELGHLVMHHSPRPDLEIEANRFAAEFLMPAKEIRPQLLTERITLDRLAALKQYWRVSMAALLFRASELNVVTERSARSLWMQFSARGFRRREPVELDCPAETPSTLAEVVSVHREHFGYDLDDLARLMHTTREEVVAVYAPSSQEPTMRRHLRAVK